MNKGLTGKADKTGDVWVNNEQKNELISIWEEQSNE